MDNKYMLISVYERNIYTEQFDSLAEAQEAMRTEILMMGREVPEDILEADEYDDGECGVGADCGYANDRYNHYNYDWRIVAIGGNNVEEG